jgi:uncharacterized protein (DUF697 family)
VSPATLGPKQVLAVARELRGQPAEARPLVVAGDPGLAGLLRRELVRDGDEGAVRQGGTAAGASAVVVVLAQPAGDAELALLREVERAGVAALAVIVERGDVDIPDPPYVLPAHVVRVPTGSGFPLDEIAGVLAGALGDDGPRLAARLPALRDAVVRELVRRHARRNGLLGVTAPARASMPLLTIDQIRLVLALATAHGRELGRERLPEVVAVVASGLALRTAARVLASSARPARRLVHGAFAYGGTRAIGEAAKRYYRAK